MVLQHRTTSWRRREYAIDADGTPVATWSRSGWTSNSSLDLDGHHYQVSVSATGRLFRMTAADGVEFARAEHPGRRQWTLTAPGREYTFRRVSTWRAEQQLVDDTGAVVGSIRRTGVWSKHDEADLPGLPVPLQVFAFVVMIGTWDAAAGAAAGT